MIRYFRKYEKLIFWAIVLLILPTFSISWIMLEVFGRPDIPPAGTLYGETVKAEDFDLARRRQIEFFKVLGREQGFRDEIVWEHLAFSKKADAAGIEVSDKEIDEWVQEFYRSAEANRRARERVLAQAKPSDDERRRQFLAQQYAREEAPKVQFDPRRYEEFLEREGTTAGEFEKTLREHLRVQKLRELVAASAKPTAEKLYERYQEQSHRRKAQWVAFPAAAYEIKDPASVTEEELRKHYSKSEDRFREPKKISVEYVAVPLDKVAAAVAEPTAGEIEARYQAVRERYRLPDEPRPATATAEPAPPPEPRYRPLDEVKDEIAKDLVRERRRDAARRKAEEIRAKVAADLAAGKEVSLEAAAKGDEALLHGKTPLVELEDLLDVKPIGHYLLLTVADKLAPGAISEVIAGNDAAFFIRAVEKREERVPPYEEIAAKVRESYTRVLDDEAEKYFNRNTVKYREPEKVAIEYIFLPYARIEKQVPEATTGTARQAELRKLAETRIEEARTAFAEPPGGAGPDAKKRELEAVALEKNVEFGKAVVEKSGKDLPAEVKAADVGSRLASGADKGGALSPVFENEAKTGVFAYLVEETIPARTPPFSEIKEKVRKDILAERAVERAREAASDFLKAVSPRKPLVPEAQKRGLEVKETGFFARSDRIEGIEGSEPLVAAIFRAHELGETGGPVWIEAQKTAYVFRYIAREAADPAGFAAKEPELRRAWIEEQQRLAQWMPPESATEWQLGVRLEARGIDEDALREVYQLRYGPDGLAEIEARHIFIAADRKVIDEALDARAKAKAESILAELEGGARFEVLARKWSQDESNRNRGGNLGFFGRGRMVKEFEEAAFGAKVGELVGPVKTQFGYHIIQVLEKKPADRPTEVRARHILIKNQREEDPVTGEPAPLDPEVRAAALAKAREKASSALARIEAGEDFVAVAQEVSDEPDKGGTRDYEYATPFEQRVFTQKPQELSEVLPADGGMHILLVTPWQAEDGRGAGGPKPVLARRVFAKGDGAQRKLDGVRAELIEARTEAEREHGINWFSDFARKFEEVARESSEAPSARRGGRIGVLEPDPDIEKFGPAFREALYSVEPGKVSGIIESKEGLSIVMVTARKKKTFEEARREIAESVLEGYEF